MRYPMIFDDLHTCRPGKLFSEVTEVVTRSIGECPTMSTHQGKFRWKDITVEAGKDGVTRRNWERRKLGMREAGTEFCVLGPVNPITPREMSLARCEMDRQTGHIPGKKRLAYAKLELLLIGLDRARELRTGRISYAYRRLGSLFPNTVICSKSASLVDIKVGRMPRISEFFSPDGNWDYKYEQKKNWRIVDASDGFLVRMEQAGLELRFIGH